MYVCVYVCVCVCVCVCIEIYYACTDAKFQRIYSYIHIYIHKHILWVLLRGSYARAPPSCSRNPLRDRQTEKERALARESVCERERREREEEREERERERERKREKEEEGGREEGRKGERACFSSCFCMSSSLLLWKSTADESSFSIFSIIGVILARNSLGWSFAGTLPKLSYFS
jgi:hypothetical protein